MLFGARPKQAGPIIVNYCPYIACVIQISVVKCTEEKVVISLA